MNGVQKPTCGRVVWVKRGDVVSPAIVQSLIADAAPFYLRVCVLPEDGPPRNVIVPHEAQAYADYFGEVWAWPTRNP